MRRRTLVSIRCAVGVFSLVCITAVLVLLRSSEAAIRARHGTLKAAEISHQLLGERRLEQVRLRSSSGLEVEIAILHPVADPRQRRPLVVLLGGLRTGRDAVELIDDSRNVVVAALSYPYQGTSKLTPWKLPQALFDVRRASIDTPAAITLALDFLGLPRSLLKFSGDSVHDYATICAESPRPSLASRARSATTSCGTPV